MVKARTDAEVRSSASGAGLRRAQLIAKLAHVITRSDGSFEEWSETLPDLIGVDPRNVPRTTRAWLDLLHPDDRPTFRARALEAEAKGVRTDVEYRLRRPDGNWIHVRQVMEPLQGRSDAPKNVRWFNTLQDITEQRRTAEALAVSEARYGAIFEQVAVGVAHSDQDGRVLNVNPKFCEISGYSREDALTVSIRALTHPDDIEKSLAAHAALLAGTSEPYEREARLIRKDRSALWAHITTSLIRSAGGEPRHFVLIVHDISDSKAAQQALADSEQRFRQLAENIREVFWLTDPMKNQILYVSPAYEQIWGRTVDALHMSPRDWLEAIHPGDRERVMAAAQSKQVVGTYDEEYRITRPDGTVRWIRDRAFPVRDRNGEVIRVAGVAEDITERKHAADALGESERRFSEILGKVQLVSLMLDRDARIIYCNDYLLRLSGWTREEVSARNWFDVFMPPEIAQDLKGVFTSLLADLPDAWHHENEILTRSGDRRSIQWNNIVLRSSAGDVIGTASIGEDITERKRDEEVRARMAAIVESSDDAIIGKTLDGVITSWNGGARKLFGYRPEEMIGQPVSLIIPQDRRAEEEEILGRLRRGDRVTQFETTRKHKDGRLIEVALTISPIHDAQGRVIGASKIARDITERKRADVKIRHLNRVYAVLSSIDGLIVRVRDRDELFREACRIAVEAGRFRLAWLGVMDRTSMLVNVVAWHGVDEEYIKAIQMALSDVGSVGRGLAGLAVNERAAIVSNDIAQDPRISLQKQSLERGMRSLVILPLVIGGEAVGVLGLYAGEVGFFDDEEMRLLRELAGDIAFALDHIEKANKLDYLSYYDQLTGFANRTLFLERLTQRVHAAGVAGDKIGLVIADVERFRMVNDSLGRQAGDALLKQLGERLVRSADLGELARIGGDVFAIVLQGVRDRSGVERRIDKTWQDAFSEPFRVGESEIRISAKAGIAMLPDDGADAETLFRSAEAALRMAKETGERHVFHAPEMSERSIEKLTFETKLRQALKNEEFVLHYQPKVEVETRRIVGVEALIRWQSPELGLVPPLQFIPLMEKTGMILEAGAWALSKAVADHLRWMQLGLEAPRVAVNISSIQLRKRDFVTMVAEAVKRGAAPPGIDLEITESLVMEDIEANIQKLTEVRKLGIAIAIDDFGTGYSSLGYLAKLPVQTLKVDRSFIITMLDNSNTMTLVQTIISLAHSLKLKVVAEGVDSEDQAKMLRLLRCDEMQGYLFSRPVPFDQMTALLQR
jgi:PAS domain S-box-containing protein/diguanylate cyclase (GGDEF)-like protein